MSYGVKFLPAARDDIRETIQWYNEQQKGMGAKFYRNFVSALKVVRSNPKLFQIRYKDIRQSPVKKFPFQLHYLVEDQNERIVVLAVLHASRNPQIWKERTQ